MKKTENALTLSSSSTNQVLSSLGALFLDYENKLAGIKRIADFVQGKDDLIGYFTSGSDCSSMVASTLFEFIDEKKYWFSARSRSIFQVVRVFEARGQAVTEDEVEAFILRGIKALTDAHFVQRVIQWDDPKCVADVYGITFDGCPWYVKFLVDEEGILEQISFHPPERDLTTVSGIKVPKGEFGS